MGASVLFGPQTMNAPWGLESRLRLVETACEFFSFEARTVEARHRIIGKEMPKRGVPEPFSLAEFLRYLELKNVFSKPPNGLRVTQLLDEMVASGLLLPTGSKGQSVLRMNDRFLFLASVPGNWRGAFRWVPVLGAEFLYRLCEPGLVHITGTNDEGVAVAGTGLIISPSHVLTCRHVVSDMKLDSEQTFQGKSCAVSAASIHAHDEVDVAVIEVTGAPLAPIPDAMFQAPVIAQQVHTLGYPKLPGLMDASVTMQQGAVTNESVTSLSGEQLFLYSAISRPGNSGGPVVSDDGYIVGLSIVDSTAEYQAGGAFSPHYAGIPGQVVVGAVASMGLGLQLPFEEYE